MFLACLSSLISHLPTFPLFHFGHAGFLSLLWTQNALSFLNVLPSLLVHLGDLIQKASPPATPNKITKNQNSNHRAHFRFYGHCDFVFITIPEHAPFLGLPAMLQVSTLPVTFYQESLT